MSDFNLYSVNWQDGMLLSMQHLKDQEKYFETLARWYAADAGNNYGLVKKSPDQPALSLNASLSGNRLRVEVSHCRALTSGGIFIEFNPSLDGGNVLSAEADINETSVPIFIAVDPAEKNPTGDPDASEEVPRLPYRIPKYTIHLIDPPGLPESHWLQIARMSVSGSDVNPAPDYFPPCVNICADERLAAMAVDYRNRMENILALSTRAFMAVTSAGALEGASTTLKSAFKDTMYYLVYHMSSHLDDFILEHRTAHPSRMIIQFKKLFRLLSSLLGLQPSLKDYLNERFFVKEHKTDIGRFTATVDDFLLSEYDHNNIAGQIQMIDGILGVLRGLMGFLAQTRPEELADQAVATETLTYQGQTYQNTPYQSCRLEQVGELSYLIMDLTEPGPLADVVILIAKDLYTDTEWRSMQIRLGINEARGLGETDPIDIDITTFANKVALHPRDMLQSSAVRQVTLIFRGTGDPQKMANLSSMDLILYTM
jgi:hypothetical protein